MLSIEVSCHQWFCCHKTFYFKCVSKKCPHFFTIENVFSWMYVFKWHRYACLDFKFWFYDSVRICWSLLIVCLHFVFKKGFTSMLNLRNLYYLYCVELFSLVTYGWTWRWRLRWVAFAWDDRYTWRHCKLIHCTLNRFGFLPNRTEQTEIEPNQW